MYLVADLFVDESFVVPHACRGIVSMANSGYNTNASQFFITLKPMPYFNGKNVAFGRVVAGDAVLHILENQPLSYPDRPTTACKIGRAIVWQPPTDEEAAPETQEEDVKIEENAVASESEEELQDLPDVEEPSATEPTETQPPAVSNEQQSLSQ